MPIKTQLLRSGQWDEYSRWLFELFEIFDLDTGEKTYQAIVIDVASKDQWQTPVRYSEYMAMEDVERMIGGLVT